MRNKYFIIVLILVSTLFIYNCSEIKDDITDPEVLEGVHPEGFGTMGADNFHTFKIKANSWDMTGCQKCHASDYSGGTAGVSCLDCHQDAGGPESCNTCHGDFSDDSRIAPPTDLANNYLTSAKGVGAHTAHVYESTLFLGAGCYDCHPGNVGDDNYITAHSDGIPAEMNFSGIADSGLSSPTYNSDLTCSNTYCHGNFSFKKSESENQWAYTDSLIIGMNFSPKWNIVDDTQAACGTCHLLPPAGHISAGNDPDAVTCKNCHSTVYNEDGSLNKFIHINGEANTN